jgi:predicted nucleic acid-binding protein
MTGPFFDTGVVLKLVVEEPLSATARSYVARRSVSVLFTRLVELEVENALQALAFRKAITKVQLFGARRLVGELIQEGRFRRVNLSLDRIATEALRLASVVTAKTGCRTLDLMHVATAKLFGVGEFVSTDKRQLVAARICGLRAINLQTFAP